MEISDGLWMCLRKGHKAWGPSKALTLGSSEGGGVGCLTAADPKTDPI
jgi:hypothetical protein